MNTYPVEVTQPYRFQFGKNWQRFLSVVDEKRIYQAEQSLKKGLDIETLEGQSFLDIGCGSGLFSLAARRLGAQVYSFDCDEHSIECVQELRRRYFPDDTNWIIEQGSILDRVFLAKLNTFDIIYAWGVLHHTGAMWQALENVTTLVRPDGKLFLAIYNYQVYWTTFNTVMKRAYVRSPIIGKWFIAGIFIGFQITKGLLKDILFLHNPVQRYLDKKKSRGMSVFYDWIDWAGGYPFETAKPEEIFDYCKEKGFTLLHLQTAGGGHGCNEFVFEKTV